jgi:hypothetical protein
MTNAIKVLLQMTSVSLQPVPSLKSIQKSKNHQRRIFLDNYYRQRCLV